MIFISHNSKDKYLVTPIADELAKIFGRENVFYDSWSIQPGDSLIGEMNEGLKKCKYFFLFVSANSINSKMVTLEWRTALIKSTKGETKFIPVRLEKVEMPVILTDSLYIDTINSGLSDTIRQIVDVIKGVNTYDSAKVETGFHNLVAYVEEIEKGIRIEFKAEHYMEPISKYVVLVTNPQSDFTVECPGESMYESGFKEAMFTGYNGETFNAMLVGRTNPTIPGFPFPVEFKRTGEKEINIVAVMKQKTANDWKSFPLLKK